MKEKRVRGLDIIPPKASAFKYETHPDLPKLHEIRCSSGREGVAKELQ